MMYAVYDRAERRTLPKKSDRKEDLKGLRDNLERLHATRDVPRDQDGIPLDENRRRFVIRPTQ